MSTLHLTWAWVPHIVREMSGNFRVSGEWSPCIFTFCHCFTVSRFFSGFFLTMRFIVVRMYMFYELLTCLFNYLLIVLVVCSERHVVGGEHKRCGGQRWLRSLQRVWWTDWSHSCTWRLSLHVGGHLPTHWCSIWVQPKHVRMVCLCLSLSLSLSVCVSLCDCAFVRLLLVSIISILAGGLKAAKLAAFSGGLLGAFSAFYFMWVRGCRIGPLRFLAGWCKRCLNLAFRFVLV